MSTTSRIPPLESALDYLTVTCRSEPNRTELRELGRQLQRELSADGFDMRAFTWRGYEGITSAWCTVAERDDSLLVRISGPEADHWFLPIAQLATHVTRIDLAVTCRVPTPQPDVAADCFRAVSAASRLRGKPLKTAYIINSEGGSTCYVGSRVSDLFARVYNKDRESGRPEYTEAWRWELEVKGRTAQHYADALLTARDRAQQIAGTVAHYFAERGAVVAFDSANTSHIRPLPREKTDTERRLRWLREQVAPVLGKLSSSVERHELLSSLGLSVTSSSVA